MRAAVTQNATQRQTQTLARLQIRALELLAKSLPELRAEIAAEMSRNPAIEDVEHPLEAQLSAVAEHAEADDAQPDYPEEDFEPGINHDEEAAERRQAFFDNQVKEETLQEHLSAQLPLSAIPEADWALAEMLIGDLDANGYFKGSIPDIQMSFGVDEAHVLATLKDITSLDPPGCGARTPRECLTAQLDKLEGSPRRDLVAHLIADHLEDISQGRFAHIMATLGIDRATYVAALKDLRSLDPLPGRAFPSARDRVEYVNPEIHSVQRQGRWYAETDARSLPEIHFSTAFAALLDDPKQSPETKAYVRERIAAAEAFRDAIAKRQVTIADISQAIYDRQQAFFTEGFKALVPMTETEIAHAVGVHPATVSRTVRDKYAATPQGTVELRRFFTTAVKTADGTTISRDDVLGKLQELIATEDSAAPLSDSKLAELLKAAGYPVARRTVAKYREKLGLAGATERHLA